MVTFSVLEAARVEQRLLSTNHPWAAAPSDAHLLMRLHLGLGKAFPVAVAALIFSLEASGETLSLAAC